MSNGKADPLIIKTQKTYWCSVCVWVGWALQFSGGPVGVFREKKALQR